MSKEVEILLNEIQFKTQKTLEEIAADIGYSRPYLNNVKLKGGGEKIIGLLKHKYKDILQNVPLETFPETEKSLPPITGDKDKTIEYLAFSNKVLVESNAEMVRMHRDFLLNYFNSSGNGSASSSLPGAKIVEQSVEYLPLGKSGSRAVQRKGEQKGISKPVGK